MVPHGIQAGVERRGHGGPLRTECGPEANRSPAEHTFSGDEALRFRGGMPPRRADTGNPYAPTRYL